MGLKKDKILDDIARVAGGTVNVVSGMTSQIKDEIKSRIDDAVHRMDLVPREDFERLEITLSETIKRIDALEGKTPSKPKTKSKKTAVKKAASKTKPKTTASKKKSPAKPAKKK